MSQFRSEDMELYKVAVHKDSEWQIMNELGKLNQLQFIDLNRDKQPFELKFTPEISACEHALKKIAYIEAQYEKFGITQQTLKSTEQFQSVIDAYGNDLGKADQLLFNDINEDLTSTWTHMKGQWETLQQQITLFKQTVFKIAVLWKIQRLTGGYRNQGAVTNEDGDYELYANAAADDNRGLLGAQISYIGGVIASDQIAQFKRFIIRATRCQVFVHSFDLYLHREDQLVGDPYDVKKSIFVLAFQDGSVIEDKIRRICNSFPGDIFEVKLEGINEEIQSQQKSKEQTRDVIRETKSSFKEYLKAANTKGSAEVSIFKVYKMYLMREKQINTYLNMLQENKDSGNAMVSQGLVWVPKYWKFEEKVDSIVLQQNLTGLTYEKGPENIPGLTKPTLFRLNDFTWAFQEIINTYGVPGYKEANPALFSAVSFPFLFGVMFGDIMHGTLLTLFASYLCWAKATPGSLAHTLSQARYLFLVMGLSAFYNGLIYNDFSSAATEIFGKSCYTVMETSKEDSEIIYAHRPDVAPGNECVYPFGFDPIWFRTEQEIAFMNSFKMKMSVILGVSQMLLGTCLKGFNAVYFGRYVELVFVVITQILLMLALFGFMNMLIVVKWTTNWDQVVAEKLATSGELWAAPGIIAQMIVMFINGGVPPAGDRQLDLIDDQTAIMKSLLIVAAVTIPCMLLVDPIWQSQKNKAANEDVDGYDQAEIQEDNEIVALVKPLVSVHGAHGFGELFIHSMIETIEYALGTISNTASYLRLWALSLAHGQLAKVFFDYTLGMGLKSQSYPAVFFGMYFFMGATFAVIMLMDSLEAFLHCVRLHWVEFNNKFYKGNGQPFNAYSFEALIAKQDRD